MENLKNPDKKKDIARKTAEITLKKVRKYEDLSAPNLEEGDKVFKGKTRELWKHFAVQGSIGKEGILPFAGDLDAKGSLYLLRLAGILSPKNFEVYERTLEKKQDEEHPRTELKYKGKKDRTKKSDKIKSVKVISFVPAGDVLKGAIHLDTGSKEGIVTEEDATVYFDHHGAESGLSSSATKKLYEGLTSLGMIEKDRNLEKMIGFITQIDNGTFPDAETYFPVFHKTVLGLQRFISPESLYKFFQDNRKPTHLLSDKELENYGLKKNSVRQKELDEKCKKEIVKLKEEGFVVDTKNGGKALISVGRRWPGDYLAAKYFKCDTYIIWSPEQQSFFVSNNEDGLEFDLPQGVNVRGKMWIKPRTDGKPLEISLKDILGRIAPTDFKPQGELAKYLESEGTKSYNIENMNPELSKKPAPPTAETTPPPYAKALIKAEAKASDADVPVAPKPFDLPTDDQVRGAMVKSEAKKNESKEVAPEKTRIELAREAYLVAKSEVEAKKNSIKESTNLTDEEVENNFTNSSPVARKLVEKFNLSREEYFGARGEEMEKELGELEDELKSKGLSAEDYAKEMKKASLAYLLSEFKQLYDAKTDLISVQNQAESSNFLKLLYSSAEWYRKLPLQNKLAVSGLLLTGGVAAGAAGGTIGAALAAVVTGGKISQSILSSAGFSVALEAGIKQQQKGEFESARDVKFGEATGKAFEGASGAKKEELLEFLKSKDKDIESMGWAAEKDVRGVEKSLERRRWLFSGVAGALLGSGLAAEAISNVGKGIGYLSDASGLSKFFGEKTDMIVPQTPAQVAETLATVAKEANQTVTIEKGGSVSQAAHTLVKDGKLSMEQFKQAWDSSFVEIKGVKVPIKDISLVHSGDQVVYVESANGGAGRFEVVDYAKDKLGLGTNQDLFAMYEKSGKEVPVWLEKATMEDVSDAFKDDSFSANDARVVEFHHSHGSLKDQLEIEEKLFNKMGLPENQGKPFSDMFVKLSASPEHAQSMRIFENHLSEIGFDFSKAGEYEAIKNVRIGDLLEKRGRSWFKDYFFSSELTDKNGEKVSKVGMGLQRKLVEYVRSLVSTQDKQLTVEQFLQKLS